MNEDQDGGWSVVKSEPLEPSRVDKVSGFTPRPPTAALPTIPEKPETIAAQMEQLGSGLRKVVMLPAGTAHPGYFPPNVALTNDGLGSTYAYRKDIIKKAEIKNAARNNRLPEVLGSSKYGMASPDKSMLGPDPVTVVSRAPDGTEAQSTVTDERHFPATILAAKHLTPRGGRISIETPRRVVRQRLAYQPAPATTDFGIPSEIK